MNRTICIIVSATLLLSAADMSLAKSSRTVKKKPAIRVVKRSPKRLGTNFNAKLSKVSKLSSNISALALVENKKYAAGDGKLGLLDSKGQMLKAIKLPFKAVAGLSPFTKGACLVGDEKAGSVYKVDIAKKKVTKLFDLKTVKNAKIKASNIITKGKLAGVAFDGKDSIFVATNAGYSSSIFKISAKSKKIVGHAFAPGPSPTALQFEKGKLYVVDQRSKKLRTFSPALKLSANAINLPVDDARGLLISGSTAEILSNAKKGVAKLTLSKQAIAAPIKIITALKPILVAIKIPPIIAFPRKFAVLITGDVAESGYDEFWNDTVWMYKTLLNRGYAKENIYVLYGNGADYSSANPKYRCSHTVTDFPATTTWVNKVFTGMKNGDGPNGIKKLRDNDSLFVWTFDHGSYISSTSAYLCLMDAWMTSSTFASKLNAVKYNKRAIFMQQCYSGGFINSLQNGKTYISTACRATETAHRADTEKESYGGSYYHHGEYNYYVTSAIDGKKPTGSNVNADSNNDGKVSAREAHVYMTNNENRPEIPQSSGNTTGNAFKF